MSRTLSAPQPRHHAVPVGTGSRAALYLPGTGWYAESGRPIADALAASHTTHLLDLPGAGRSRGLDGLRRLDDAVDWVEDYLDAAGLASADMIGHSLGGAVALTYAVARPERVARLVLLDVGYARAARLPVRMFGPVGLFVPVVDLAHRMWGEAVLGPPADTTPPADPETERPDVGRHGLALLLAHYRTDLPGLLRRLERDCLVLYGDRSGEPARRRARVARQIAAVRAVGRVQARGLRGGHDAHRSDPRAGEEIRAFLARD